MSITNPLPHSSDSPPGSSRQPYHGPSRKLLIAMDVGTTFSGISYSILEPGETPQIHCVTRFPGQEHQAGSFKIPTIMWYDRSGVVQAAGAEAELPENLDRADDQDWVKAEWFKIHLRPQSLSTSCDINAFKPLPPRKTVVQVFGDFLKYMLSCARSFIEESHGSGRSIWASCQNDVQFVLTHPNGWEGSQQSKMRDAAVHGGLVPDTHIGHERIFFVTEGEASLHSCLANGLAGRLETGDGILIADAGGGTLDFSSYRVTALNPLKVCELLPAACSLQGSIFVSARAREFFQAKLANSRYGTPDNIEHITEKFDETTKKLFRDPFESSVVAFGSPVDRDPKVNIRNGQLRLAGQDVSKFFEPSIESAKTTIEQYLSDSHGLVKSVFLVGGFAASPWLLKSLQGHFSGNGVTISRPDGHTAKAVAEGAVLYHLDHLVISRVARFTYGTYVLRDYDSRDSGHAKRSSLIVTHPITGHQVLTNGFCPILDKGTSVTEIKEFSTDLICNWGVNDDMSHEKLTIAVYRGNRSNIRWLDEDEAQFSSLCTIEADMSTLRAHLQRKTGKTDYITASCQLILHFGAELKAQVSWKEGGKEKRGPVKIVYDPDA